MKKFHISSLFLGIGCLLILSSCSTSNNDALSIFDMDDETEKVVSNSYNILPGDVLQITVWKEEGMDQEVLVLPDGTITFPLLGTIQTNGLSPSDLQQKIITDLSSKIPDASVTVNVKDPAGHKVSIIGQVLEPGEVIIYNQMSVMEALSQVGGLTPYADESDIIIIRRNMNGEKEKLDFPYKDIAKGKNLDKDFDLKPGDVVVIPTAGLF